MKQLYYGELISNERKAGGQRKHYKDTLKAYLKNFNIVRTKWENVVSNRLT